MTPWVCMSTRCGTRGAPRTSAPQCGWNTFGDPGGRRWPSSKPDAAADAGAGEAPSAAELSNAPLLGVAYGYPGAPGQWWQQQVVLGLQRGGLPPQEIARLMTSYFELTELHIHPRAQGHGLGEALARRLLAGRGERNVLLSTPGDQW